MHEALLYEQLDDQVVLCQLCPWKCQIPAGALGRCQVRQNQEGFLYTLNYGLVSAAAIEPIELGGVYHLFPGSMVLSLGGWGNNLACRHRPVPGVPEDEKNRRFLDPERMIEFALDRRCRGIAWRYQEPGVWMEYVLDAAKLAKANGFFTFIVTNSMINKEALDLLGPYLNGYIVELLAAEASVYENLCELPHWREILETTAYAKERWNCHIEVHTPLILGINREEGLIHGVACWIRDEISVDIPWHLWAYEPAGEMSPQAAPAQQDLEWAQKIGQEAGLRYVYIQQGDQVGRTPTHCPSCGNLLIRRESNFLVKKPGIQNGRCTHCNLKIYLSQTIFK
ncbi:MAG: hypothetical protein JXA37_14100 [Chloroflexia bacterium]|nr:hypothetical protein [Chloroflexia bacterium]